MKEENEKHNQQYKKNHTIIVTAILKLMRHFRVHITCARIAKETGLSRGTIKNHATDLNKLIDEVETALLGQFMVTVGKVHFNEKMSQKARKVNEAYFMSLLLFMSKRKRIFGLICADENNRELLRKMMAVLYGKLKLRWFPENEPVPTEDSKPGRMYIAMAVEMITEWGQETGCKMERAGDCLRRLQNLTDTVSVKCK